MHPEVPQQGEGRDDAVREVEDQLVHFVGEGADEAVEEQGDDIQEVETHEAVHYDRVRQQPVPLQCPYLQEVGPLPYRFLPQLLPGVTEKLQGALPQVGHAQEVRRNPVAVELEEGVEGHHEAEIQDEDQVAHDVVPRQEERQEQDNEPVALEVDAGQVHHAPLCPSQLPYLGHVRIEHGEVQVEPETYAAVPHAEVFAGGGVPQFVEERRAEHEGQQPDHHINIYLVVEQQQVVRREEKPEVHPQRQPQHYQHTGGVEQEAEPVGKPVDGCRTEQLLLVEERPLRRLRGKEGRDELVDNLPHLLRGVFPVASRHIGGDGLLFGFVPLQLFHQVHDGTARLVVLPAAREQVPRLLGCGGEGRVNLNVVIFVHILYNIVSWHTDDTDSTDLHGLFFLWSSVSSVSSVCPIQFIQSESFYHIQSSALSSAGFRW